MLYCPFRLPVSFSQLFAGGILESLMFFALFIIRNFLNETG